MFSPTLLCLLIKSIIFSHGLAWDDIFPSSGEMKVAKLVYNGIRLSIASLSVLHKLEFC